MRHAGVVVLVMSALLCAGCIRSTGVEGPVAGVLDGKGRVVLVDLARGAVIDTVHLSTWSSDIDADPGHGVFVTAQGGGVGTDADDRMAIVRVRGRRSVDYVTLRRPNPNGVAVIGDGRVLVDHGWQERQGMYSCVVDVAGRRVVREGHIPDSNQPLTVIDGVGWASCVDALTDRPALRRVELPAIRSQVMYESVGYPRIECAVPGGLAGWIQPRDAAAVLARFDGKTGAVEATAAVDFADGPGRLVHVGGRLVAVDHTGTMGEKTGYRLLVFDAGTLELQRSIRLSGGPSDVAVWRDRVVTANWKDQTLQVVDPATGTIDKTVRLPELTDLPLLVAVLDE